MIIVTGGSGFIGSAIVAGLNAKGVTDILIVDILGKDEKWKNLRSLSFTDYLEADNFLDLISTGRFGLPIEAVFHLGACSSTTETDASFLLKNNFEYSKSIAAFALDKKARSDLRLKRSHLRRRLRRASAMMNQICTSFSRSICMAILSRCYDCWTAGNGM